MSLIKPLITTSVVWLMLSGLMLSPQTEARTVEAVKRLKTLIDEKQFSDAYRLSGSLLEEWGGDPIFDLLAGQAAYGAGHFQEAVFAFERVLIVKPDVLLARLYLAFSYFQVKNLGAAETELTKLLQEDLDVEDAAKVREYLEKIVELKAQAVTNHTVNVRLSYGYDSNANSGTTLDNLSAIPPDSPFFPIIGSLDDTSLEQSDHSTDVNLNYVFNRKLTQKRAIGLNATYINTRFDRQSQLDRDIVSITGVFSDQWGNANINITAFAQPMMLNSEFFRAAYGTSFDMTWSLNEQWLWMWGLSYTSVNINANDTQDLNQMYYRSRLTFKGTALQMLEIGYGDDNSKLDDPVSISNSREFWALTYTVLYPINNKWMLVANTSFQDIEFDGANPAIGLAREETNLTALLSLDYLLSTDWKLTSAISFTNKNSNVGIYAYDRTTAIFAVTRTF